jgi:hypothetical protein
MTTNDHSQRHTPVMAETTRQQADTRTCSWLAIGGVGLLVIGVIITSAGMLPGGIMCFVGSVACMWRCWRVLRNAKRRLAELSDDRLHDWLKEAGVGGQD